MLILDQSFLNIFLKKIESTKKNIRLIILFWNRDLDYFLYENQVKRLKKNFRLYCFTLSNFYKIQNLYFLNNFKIKKKIKKKMNVSGLNFLKQTKHRYPLIFSIINSILNFNIFKKIVFSKKIIFIGTTSINKDLLNKIKIYKFDNRVLEIIDKFYKKKIFNTNHIPSDELSFLKKVKQI